MINDLRDRKKKLSEEMIENQKNPELIATTKGQNIQNLENSKKRNEELQEELNAVEERFNRINLNLKDTQEKLANLRENKARNEATLDGIETRKKDLFFQLIQN